MPATELAQIFVLINSIKNAYISNKKNLPSHDSNTRAE